MIVEETIYLNRLFDMYGNLLTDRQKEVFKLYYHEDYSYQEIADILQISRSGVFDTLQRGISSLKNYEEELDLLNRLSSLFEKLESLKIEDVDKLIEDFYEGGNYVKRISG